jgi:hypothetical protein
MYRLVGGKMDHIQFTIIVCAMIMFALIMCVAIPAEGSKLETEYVTNDFDFVIGRSDCARASSPVAATHSGVAGCMLFVHNDAM